jgi:3-dehydroquinate dehydratase/shikimate dehydrogenase
MGRGPFGSGVRRICGVAAASTAAEMRAQVREALRETPTVELRLDWLRDDRERERFLGWLERAKRGLRGAVFIATCRTRAGGGKLRGGVEAEMRWLARAREAGCEWCDVEVESVRGLPGRESYIRGLRTARSGRDGVPLQRKRENAETRLPPRVLLSLHDFRRTPRWLGRKVKQRKEGFFAPLSMTTRELRRGVNATKIAAEARSLADSIRVLRVARGSSDRIVVPMGEIGLPGRILALREGSALAYAPVGGATAPGQVSLWELKHLYRAHELNRQTRVYGVIGNPVGHSLSPLMHNTGFVARRVNAVYVPFLVKDLRDFLNFLQAAPEFGVKGFSVTLPHKKSILRHLDECEALAAEIGAVNTVAVRGDGSLYGCNTDYVGVLRALEKKFRIAGSRVLIFGAGGGARAAAFALTRRGAAVVICARREKVARELARAVTGEAVPRRALRTESFDAIVNATPVGMYPHAEISPLEVRELHCRVVMDLIYRPERTKLLKMAAGQGIATVSGVEMFVAQGVAQWELWMKRRAPEAAMRKAVVSALRTETRHRRSR